MSDLIRRYEEYRAKISDKNYKGRRKTERMMRSYQEVVKGDDWHNNPGQKQSLETRKQLYETPEWKQSAQERAQQLAQDPQWKENNQRQLQRNNTDPEILARRYEANKVTWKSVTGPQGVFDKVSAFQSETGMNFNDKRRLLPHLYYYTADGPGEVKTEKVYYTPQGHYPSMLCAQEMDGTGFADYQHLVHKPHIKWFKGMMKKYPDQYYIKTEPKREWILEIGRTAK